MGANSSQLHGDINVKTMVSMRGALNHSMKKVRRDGRITYEEAFQYFLACESTSKVIKDYFPEALDNTTVVQDVINTLESYGLTAETCLYAQSACPDEINHEPTSITNMFVNHFDKKVFHIGGLAGIPFCGSTGFGAFSHHIPEHGHMFIMFCPHIGLSESGHLGKYTRVGQNHDGTACGAAVGAFNAVKGASSADCCLSDNPTDYQMKFIISEMSKRRANLIFIKDPEALQAQIAREIYEITKQFIDDIVTTEFGVEHDGKVALLGGIQVNMPDPLEDIFVPLSFELRSDGQPTIDLMYAFKESKDLHEDMNSKCALQNMIEKNVASNTHPRIKDFKEKRAVRVVPASSSHSEPVSTDSEEEEEDTPPPPARRSGGKGRGGESAFESYLDLILADLAVDEQTPVYGAERERAIKVRKAMTRSRAKK